MMKKGEDTFNKKSESELSEQLINTIDDSKNVSANLKGLACNILTILSLHFLL